MVHEVGYPEELVIYEVLYSLNNMEENCNT